MATTLPSAYSTTLKQSLAAGGSESEIYVSSITTLDGQTLTTGDFAQLGSAAYLVIDPLSSVNYEICSFTAVDGSGIGFTGITRGLSLKGDGAVIAANKKFHAVGTTVIIAWGAPELNKFMDLASSQTIAGTKTFSTIPVLPAANPTTANQAARKQYVDDTMTGLVGTASTTTYGTVKTTTATNTVMSTDDTRLTTQSGTALDGSSNKIIDSSSTASTSTNNAIVKANGSGIIDTTFLSNAIKRGGTGTDGALSISSGTTTINLGSASVVVKNYTSISITGTGQLAFSNPASGGTIVILKSQDGVTLTSSTNPLIDLRGIGGAGGTGGNTAGGGSSTNAGQGAGGSSAIAAGSAGNKVSISFAGNGGTGSSFGTWGFSVITGGQGGCSDNSFNPAGGTITPPLNSNFAVYAKAYVIPGSGGGGSGTDSSGSHTAPNGGIGGGALYIECVGAWNFTGTINAAGGAGIAGSGVHVNELSGGGGGGSVVALVGSITANTGTITVTGGAPNGANGFSVVALNTELD